MTPEEHKISEGYISKAEAAAKFGRHDVTLSNDIIAAITRKDKEILPLLKLVTKDRVERMGTDKEVTVALVKKLKKEGMQPRWFLHPTDAVPLFIKRKSRGKSTATKTDSKNVPQGSGTSVGSTLPEEGIPTDVVTELATLRKDVSYLEEANKNLREDKRDAKSEMKELKDVLKRQAIALQDSAKNALVDKQTIRELRLQIEAPATQPQGTKKNAITVVAPQAPKPTGSDHDQSVAKPTNASKVRTAQSTPSTPNSATGMSGGRWERFKKKHLPTLAKLTADA